MPSGNYSKGVDAGDPDRSGLRRRKPRPTTPESTAPADEKDDATPTTATTIEDKGLYSIELKDSQIRFLMICLAHMQSTPEVDWELVAESLNLSLKPGSDAMDAEIAAQIGQCMFEEYGLAGWPTPYELMSPPGGLEGNGADDGVFKPVSLCIRGKKPTTS
jgi:hypothetical protein